MEYIDKVIKQAAERANLDLSKYDVEQIKLGMPVEMEHGSELGDDTNVSNDDPVDTLKIVLAHLKEIPDYYTRLNKMEDDAKAKNKPETLSEGAARMKQLIGESEHQDKKQLKNEFYLEKKRILQEGDVDDEFEIYEFEKKSVEPGKDDEELYSLV